MNPTRGRWLLTGAAVLLQLALGAVYAWSVFSKAMQRDDTSFHLSKPEAALPFSIAIFMIFVGTYIGAAVPILVALHLVHLH